MKRTVKILALVFLFSFVLYGGRSFAQFTPGDIIGECLPATLGATYQPTGWNTFEASWLIGYEVSSPDNAYLGQISNLVIDQVNGRIALVILSDVPGLGNKLVAIPFSSLVRTTVTTFQLNFGDRENEIGAPLSGGGDPYLDEMTRAPGNSDLYGIPSMIDSTWVAKIYKQYGQVPYWTKEGIQPQETMEFYESSKLMGSKVRILEGEALTDVNDLVIDSSDGHIALIVLSNVKGRSDNLVAVPFNVLSRSEKNAFALNITAKQLEATPSFKESTDMRNLRNAENIYSIFAQKPYWTEGGLR